MSYDELKIDKDQVPSGSEAGHERDIAYAGLFAR